MPMTFDGHDFYRFSQALRRESPELRRRMNQRLRLATAPIIEKMRREMPHQNSGGQKGIRFSTARAGEGASILIGGRKPPQSYAFAFGIGQKGRLGVYKHPVYGKWSSSPNTIEQTSDYIVRNWVEGMDDLRVAAWKAIDETLDELAFGTEA